MTNSPLAVLGATTKYSYIDDNDTLDSLCNSWQGEHAIALDTEFVRTDTFFAQVGLLQLADSKGVFLIDPLSISQWDGFKALIVDPQRLVILHSCSEDLSLMQYFLDCIPASLFDTQRAAAFIGHGYSLSYQALVKAELGFEVPKGETRSDWLARPLTAQQTQYAALDVAYLHQLKEKLQDELQNRGMFAWFEEDCRQILRSVKDDRNELEWPAYYKQLSAAWRLDDEQLLILQRLCYWREKLAREKNRPRNWIVKDNALLSLAAETGKGRTVNLRTLGQISDLNPKQLERYGQALLNCVYSSMEFPVLAKRSDFNLPLSAAQRNLLKKCQRVNESVATAMNIAPELLARKRPLVELIYNLADTGADPWPEELNGWRREILYDRVMEVLQ